MPRFQGANARQNLKLVTALKQLSSREECPPAQLAIAWLLSRRPPVVPLIGTSKRKWLEENAQAVELTPSQATLGALNETFRPGITQGDRYPAAMMARLGL